MKKLALLIALSAVSISGFSNDTGKPVKISYEETTRIVPAVGDYCTPSSFQFDGLTYPIWVPGPSSSPYSTSPEWVNKRCQVVNIYTVNGVQIANINLAQTPFGYSTDWPLARLLKRL